MEYLLIFLAIIFFILINKFFLKKKSFNKNIQLNNDDTSKNNFAWTQTLDLINDQIIILNRNKNIIFANKAAKKQFGSKIELLNYTSVIRDSNFIEAINNIYQNKESVSINSEIKFPTYQFLKANINYIDHKFFNEDFVIMVIFQDLTDLVKIEKLKSDFVANVSHELRTPLQSIKLGIETIIAGPAKKDEEAKKKFLNIMKNESNRMDRLITDLLSLSKIEQEEHKRPNNKININDILSLVSSNLEAFLKKKNIQILNNSQKNIDVRGDYNKLTEIFYNIIENAVKYSEENKEIIINSDEDEENVIIKIIDQGYGIPKTSIPRVTERFFRVDPEKSKKIGGTGLGLAIVKHLINQHRGDLEIKSELGKGSEFIVKLPKYN